MNSNKTVFYEQQVLAMNIASIFNKDVKKKLKTSTKKKTILPSLDTIYNKEVVKENDPDNKSDNIVSSKKAFNSEMNEAYSYYDDDYHESSLALTKEKSENASVRSKSSSLNYLINSDDFKSKSPQDETTNFEQLRDNHNLNLTDSFIHSSSSNKDKSDQARHSSCNSKCLLYTHRHRSRFQFANSEMSSKSAELSSEDVPNFVLDIISKNSSRYTFFKKFENEFDIDKKGMLIEKELANQNNTWSEFILSDLYSK